jgi:ribonucleotide monophosphatase NagD (HAD superfamily)
MVGDRAATDGRFARALGCRYAQVRTGVAGGDEAPGQQPELRPDEQASCLADLVPVLSDTLSPWLPRHRTTS